MIKGETKGGKNLPHVLSRSTILPPLVCLRKNHIIEIRPHVPHGSGEALPHGMSRNITNFLDKNDFCQENAASIILPSKREITKPSAVCPSLQ